MRRLGTTACVPPPPPPPAPFLLSYLDEDVLSDLTHIPSLSILFFRPSLQVGIVPVTLLPSTSSASAEHASFEGQVIFHNTFTGELSAADYPKIGWYLFLTAVYLLAGLGWGGLCWRYRAELLPIQVRPSTRDSLVREEQEADVEGWLGWEQHYISAVLGYLTVEMFVTFVYYVRYPLFLLSAGLFGC